MSPVQYALWRSNLPKRGTKPIIADDPGMQGAAQAPFVPDSKPAAPSVEVSEEDGQFAVKVIEVWKASVQAKKDFPHVGAFHAFCAECRDKEGQLRPDQKGVVGLPYYQKLINLQKGPGSRR